jgi:hypothetical protein
MKNKHSLATYFCKSFKNDDELPVTGSSHFAQIFCTLNILQAYDAEKQKEVDLQATNRYQNSK